MRILNHKDVQNYFTMEDAFQAVREASRSHHLQFDQVPVRTRLAADNLGFESLTMPGLIQDRYFGMKVWFALPAALGELPQSAAFISLFDLVEGSHSLIEASTITDFRTGAMTGVIAAEKFSTIIPTRLGIIGTGIQARTQILAILHALPSIAVIQVNGRNLSRLEHFVQRMDEEIAELFPSRNVEIRAEQAVESVVRGADIVIAATTSALPVIEDDWIDGSEVLVASIGSHTPDERELAEQTVLRASQLIVDTHAGGVNGAGDIGALVREGRIELNDVLTIGQVLIETPSLGGLTVLKTVGFAAADLYAAKMVLQRSEQEGTGVMTDFY